MDFQETIGKAIVNRRKSLNINQAELSKKSGVCRRYLSDIENGTRSVSVNVLKNLTDNLHWTLADLFAEVESLCNEMDSHPSEKAAPKEGCTVESSSMIYYKQTPEI